MLSRPSRTSAWTLLLLLAGWIGAAGVSHAQTATNVFPSTGNAGIGTTTPQAPLEIRSAGADAIMWDNGGALLRNHSDAILWNRGAFNLLLDADNDQSSAYFQLFKDVTDSSLATPGVRLTLEGGSSWLGLTGNLGVGTSSPTAKLHVFDPVGTGPSDHQDLLFDGSGAPHGLALDVNIATNWAREFKIMTGGSGTLFGFGALVANGSSLVRGYIGGNSLADTVYTDPWMTFLPDGKVGIGLLSPGSQLAVAGTVESTTGGFKFPDGTVQTTAAIGTGNSLDAADGTPANAVYVDAVGNVGIGTTTPAATLDVQGTTRTTVIEITGGADLAEAFDVGDDGEVAPGTVVSIDPRRPGKLRVADRPYDRTVAGVVSGAAGIRPGMVMGQEGSVAFGGHPVALTGRVYVRADASNGSIAPGDLLTTSATAGYAMKADPERASGAILGKAMTPLDKGSGLVLVLVTLQ